MQGSVRPPFIAVPSPGELKQRVFFFSVVMLEMFYVLIVTLVGFTDAKLSCPWLTQTYLFRQRKTGYFCYVWWPIRTAHNSTNVSSGDNGITDIPSTMLWKTCGIRWTDSFTQTVSLILYFQHRLYNRTVCRVALEEAQHDTRSWAPGDIVGLYRCLIKNLPIAP